MILLLVAGCYEEEKEYDISATSGPGYVVFEDSDTTSVSETGDTVTVNIELPLSQGENVTVNYTYSGDAVEGEDFVVVGATGGTGSVTIEYDFDDTALDEAGIQVVPLADGERDFNKSITFVITSAVTESGDELLAGQGDLDGTKPVKFIDVDCPSDISGDYAGVNCFPDPASPSTWVEDPLQNGLYSVTDFTGGYYGFAGAPSIGITIIDECGNLRADDFVFADVLEFTNISGTVNADGSISLSWTEASGFATGGNPTVCSTVFTPN